MGESVKESFRYYSMMIMFGLVSLILGMYLIIRDLHSGEDLDHVDIGFAVIGGVILIYDVWNFGLKSFTNHIVYGGIIFGIVCSFLGIIGLFSGVDKWGEPVEPSEAGFIILFGIVFAAVFGCINLLLKRNKKRSNQGMEPTRANDF